MIQPESSRAMKFKKFKESRFRPCFPKRPSHLRHTGSGTAKSYFERPSSGLLTREEIARRRGGNPKGSY